MVVVDMVEVMVMGVLIGMAEITIESDFAKMIVMHMRTPGEAQIMNLGEILIMTQDRRRIHVSGRVATLMMMMMMIGSGELNDSNAAIWCFLLAHQQLDEKQCMLFKYGRIIQCSCNKSKAIDFCLTSLVSILGQTDIVSYEDISNNGVYYLKFETCNLSTEEEETLKFMCTF
ncbi:hypothetical protein Patl1_02323 [Pistacia atlantica]|uniref:Uncharacterized protein n=1 Tax=Pistacia atlantica TaxID=434234 RepID=A0ACC1CAT9_9ROSI|nr:hypothetical protein Patl1_02323 [Pistacia atlantica]